MDSPTDHERTGKGICFNYSLKFLEGYWKSFAIFFTSRNLEYIDKHYLLMLFYDDLFMKIEYSCVDI